MCFSVCVHDLHSRPNGGKVQTLFFLYQFRNLIFIYFSKKGGGSYWRGVLVRRNVVCLLQFLPEGFPVRWVAGLQYGWWNPRGFGVDHHHM